MLRLSVSGAQVETAAAGAKLILENSSRRIAYGRLSVTDATGKELAARMEVLSPRDASTRHEPKAEDRKQKAEMAILVEDADAVYPVRIDPTFSDANWISLNPSIPGADNI